MCRIMRHRVPSSMFIETVRQATADAERPLGDRSVSRGWVIVAAIGIILLYASGIHGRWWPTPDSSGYIALGRSIAAGEGYRFNGNYDNSLPPGLPLLLAGVYRLFGENYWAFNALIALCGLGVLAVTYACLKRLTDPASALLVTVMTALGYRFFLNASRILSDMPMALVAWLAIYACLRLRQGRWAWLAAIVVLSASTVLFRVAGLLVMGALGVGVFLDARLMGPWRRRIAAALAVILPAVATLLVLYVLAHQVTGMKPLYERVMEKDAHSGQGIIESYIRQFGAAALNWPASMADLMIAQKALPYGLLLIVLWLIGVAGCTVRGEWLSPTLCILYPLALLLLKPAEDAMRSRFLVVIQPLLMLGALQGLALICGLLARRRGRDPQRKARRLVPALVAILAIGTIGCNIPRLARGVYLKAYAARTDRFYEIVDSGEYADALAAADAVARVTKPGTICLTNDYIAPLVHFRSGRLAATWPAAQDKTVESARAVHSYAAGHPEFTAVMLPRNLPRDICGELFAAELRRGFDEDPAWEEALENKSYVVYARADR